MEKTQQDPSSHRLALDNEPEFASEIGLMTSAFALLERFPPILLSRLTGMSESDSGIILGHFRSFAGKLEVIKTVCRSRGNQTGIVKAVERFRGELQEANRIRNKYAHGRFTQTEAGMTMTTWEHDANRKTHLEVLSLADVQEDTAILRATLHKLLQFQQGELP